MYAPGRHRQTSSNCRVPGGIARRPLTAACDGPFALWGRHVAVVLSDR